jgi:uncharacterized damage-inducible protein DinB
VAYGKCGVRLWAEPAAGKAHATVGPGDDSWRSLRAARELTPGLEATMIEPAHQQIVDALARAPSIIVPLIRELPEPLRKRRPRSGKWSAHEHACHLAAVQGMFFERLEQFLREEHPSIEAYVPEREHSPDALLAVDLEDALARFQRQRAELVVRLGALQASDWQRTADHEEYSHYSLFILFRHVVMHDMLHAYRIEECLLNKEWA